MASISIFGAKVIQYDRGSLSKLIYLRYSSMMATSQSWLILDRVDDGANYRIEKNTCQLNQRRPCHIWVGATIPSFNGSIP